jgi:uncharacterized protein (DUF1778 family)
LSSKPTPRATPNLRTSAHDRNLIDRAAQSIGKARTDFIVDATRRTAEERLLVPSLFLVSQSTRATRLAMIDTPAKPDTLLRRTMKASPASRQRP